MALTLLPNLRPYICIPGGNPSLCHPKESEAAKALIKQTKQKEIKEVIAYAQNCLAL